MHTSIRTIIAACLLAACSGAVDPGETGRASASEATTAGSTGDASTGGGTEGTGGDSATSGAPGICGDGVRGGDEVCDGADLGGQGCKDVDPRYSGGALACAANCMSFDASGCELPPGTALVTLNEVSSVGTDVGEWAGKGDLIELYNAGDAPADLSGYRLTDDMTLPVDKTYAFAPGTTLAPGAWLVLGELPFGLSQDKEETLVLVDGADLVVDNVTFDGAAAKVSYCRLPDGQGGWSECAPTFGAANAAISAGCGDGVADMGEACDGADLGGQTCVGLGFSGGTLACTPQCTHDTFGCDMGEALVINELEATGDDIELYNAGNAPIDVSGWILTDDIVDPNYDPMADPEKLVFAAQTTVPAKGFLVVPKGMNVNQHPFGLGADGDTVTLLKPNLEIVDQVAYAAGEADTSYCRLPDGPGGEWTPMCAATQGAPNEAG